jgi:myo-inositol-1(or 4)-monophosphatase
VTLISGPVSLTPPVGADVLNVISAQDMYAAVERHIVGMDVAIFSAAVADYRPVDVATQKIKKSTDSMTLTLERTPDILGSARQAFGYTGLLIGFAAETENLIANATSKLQRKACDLVIANRVDIPGTGFDSDLNEVILCLPDQPPVELAKDSKAAIAVRLVEQIERMAGSPPNHPPMKDLLDTAIQAAHAAGKLIRENFGSELHVNEMKKYDIKLELDVKSQELITSIILERYPDHAVLGEEGDTGGTGEIEWIVDPIDGTVNYFFGIPHFCVSIAARRRGTEDIILGVIFDPSQNELWTVAEGVPPTLNGKPISCSTRAEMSECVVTVGFSKSKESLDAGFERYKRISYSVRKTRMLGSAALAMAYIACGRLDAYVEEQISLWDIAAGKMLVEQAGGSVTLRPGVAKEGTMFICATNGKVQIAEYL